MAFDLSRLRRGEKIAAVAAVLLLIDMFLGWYGPHADVGESVTAWESFSLIDLLLLVTALAAIGLAFLTATQRTVALPVTLAVIVTALGFVATLLVAFRVLIDQPGFSVGVPDSFVDNEIWAWVGLLACAAILYGGYLSMRDEGTSLSDAADQARAAGQQARAAFDSSAPRSEQTGTAASAPPPAAPPSDPPAAAPPPPPSAPPAASEPPAAAPPPPPPAAAPSGSTADDAPAGETPPSSTA
jgi:hypothetical protein